MCDKLQPTAYRNRNLHSYSSVLHAFSCNPYMLKRRCCQTARIMRKTESKSRRARDFQHWHVDVRTYLSTYIHHITYYTYMHKYIHRYIHRYINTKVTYIHACVHKYVCMHVRVSPRAQTHTFMHLYGHMHRHAADYAYMCELIHLLMQAHVHVLHDCLFPTGFPRRAAWNINAIRFGGT